MARRGAPCLGAVAFHHFRGGLANDDQTHDESLLGAFIGEELLLSHSFDKATCIGCCLLQVINI
jgi:hypothetical protein